MTATDRRDLAGLLGLVVLAAALRFIGLDGRGTWDADQGHDMLVLRSFVRDGIVPLLGPPTSIGTFHHGALYYWLLAPAAWLTDSDPIGVTAFIALAGVGTVAATWWLARSMGGRWAGLIAGLFAAVSPAAIEQSTFIWNPNLIPVASAFGLACAWRAWSMERARWWIGAALGVGIVMQCHVLGVILLPPVVALWLADVRRTGGDRRASVVRAGLLGAVVIALMYVPLVIHELTHSFAETQAIAGWIASGGGPGPSLLERLPIVTWRVLAWPLAALITDRPIVAMLSALLVILAIAVCWAVYRGPQRVAVRWLTGTLVWSILALVVAAPSLATVVAGLPNDHYHAFVDPIVDVLLALAIAAVLPSTISVAALRAPDGTGRAVIGAVAAVILIVALEVVGSPQAKAWDGGWPAAEQSAARIAGLANGRPIQLVSLPSLKNADAVGFPLTRAAAPLTPKGAAPASGTVLVIVCDPRFTELLEGGTCESAIPAAVSAVSASGDLRRPSSTASLPPATDDRGLHARLTRAGAVRDASDARYDERAIR